ncbi:MAG: FAD-dependent oxidoreductase [Steroidobacteraceae bacterium]
MRIAIIGSGIAGLTCAHRLHRTHEITLFEANDYVGGHTATIDVEHEGRTWAIDTGFIVFNDWTYPRFIALLNELGVESQDSNMSFAVSCARSGIEYNGTSLNTLFAQRRNLVRPSFLRMLSDIVRFNARCRELLQVEQCTETLGTYLERSRYSRAFIDYYLIPMGRAIWSASASAMLSFPARFFVEFFDRHGFLNIDDRPVWRAVRGGSREYVRKLIAPLRHRVRLSTPVSGVHRDVGGVAVRTRRGDVERFDRVIFACHSDQALALLDRPTPIEQRVLAAFPYQANAVTLHTDASVLPRTPLARAAWNYHVPAEDRDAVALTYDMNVLQSLDARERFLVTLNRRDAIASNRVLGEYVYHHPVYTPDAVRAQKLHAKVSGLNSTYYCGAYWGYGFHEDGVVSAERVVAQVACDFAGARNELSGVGR